MLDIGIGVSQEKNPSAAAKEAVKAARENSRNKRVDLAIVFSSSDIAYIGLLKTITDTLGSIPLVGSSGAAVISNQGVFKHGLALMLLSFPEGVHFNTACAKDIKSKSGIGTGEELGAKLLQGLHNSPRTLGLLLADGLIEEDANLIYGVQERLGKSFPLFGASASDNINLSRAPLYFNQELCNDACLGLLLGGKINFGLGIKHGWKPLGKPHTVTVSRNNVVEKIDGAPAVKLYEDYLGFGRERLKQELRNISILYPIGIYLGGEKEYLLRNILSVEEDGSLHFRGNVPANSTVRLMIGTKETCLDATKQALEEAKQNLSDHRQGSLTDLTKDTTNALAIVFSSVSRYALLKRDAPKELDIIKRGLEKNIPIIGLYTYSEVAPLKAVNYRGEVYSHNQSIAVAIIEG